MEERKGFLTPDQEKLLDELIVLKGVSEALDGPAIRIADNVGLQKLKDKLLVESPEVLELIYMVVDEIFTALGSLEEPLVTEDEPTA